MKTYKEFTLSEATFTMDHRSDITKLGAAIVEAGKLHKRISELADRLSGEVEGYKGATRTKLTQILAMCKKPEEVARDSIALKNRLIQVGDGVEK